MSVCVFMIFLQACPPSSRHIRAVQCSSYNNQPFMGRLYEWEPFNDGRPCVFLCNNLILFSQCREAASISYGKMLESMKTNESRAFSILSSMYLVY